MPELPEVETIRRDLEKALLKRRIVGVEVKKPKLVRNTPAQFKKALVGKSFTGIERRGKLLIFSLSDKKNFLLVHLKMTGQLIYKFDHQTLAGGHHLHTEDLQVPHKYTHIIFTFSDKSKLYFNDMRLFGYMQVVDESRKIEVVATYGPEPLDAKFTLAQFKTVFARSKRTLKAVLMDQTLIAGIGNIYADEIAFDSGIRPHRPVAKLTDRDIKNLYHSTKKVLKKAVVHRGTSFSDYVDGQGGKGTYMDFLFVYGREGQKCKKCKKGIISKDRHAGRGTHMCPVCQK